jgi:hypothetical protein
MSEHGPDGSATILGYTICRSCEHPVPQEIARVTGGVCAVCQRLGLAPVLKQIEVRSQGRRITLTRPGRKKRKGAKSRNELIRQHRVDKAKRAALRRLRDAFPEYYAMLLADERGKLGLEPYPMEAVLATASGVNETVGFAALYHALTEHGVADELEDLESPHPDAQSRDDGGGEDRPA